MKDSITTMMKIRTRNKIGPASKLRILLAENDAYVAEIDGSVLAKVGPRYDVSKYVPDGDGYQVTTSGSDFAIWEKRYVPACLLTIILPDCMMLFIGS
jgi:alpha-amylase